MREVMIKTSLKDQSSSKDCSCQVHSFSKPFTNGIRRYRNIGIKKRSKTPEYPVDIVVQVMFLCGPDWFCAARWDKQEKKPTPGCECLPIATFSARKNDTRVTRLQFEGHYDLVGRLRIAPPIGKDRRRFDLACSRPLPGSLHQQVTD
jgi:hypothetical protein